MPVSMCTPTRRKDLLLCVRAVDFCVDLGTVDIWNVLSYMFTA